MTKEEIYTKTKELYSQGGNNAVSMRNLAQALGVTQSTLYNYFDSKDELLKECFDYTRKTLGQKRSMLQLEGDLKSQIESRIEFQFNNSADVIFILKYYMDNRNNFPKNKQGYVPETAYLHIKEVLENAVKKGTLGDVDIDSNAKIITHAINGFVIEYYPEKPKKDELKELKSKLAEFIVRSIS